MEVFVNKILLFLFIIVIMIFCVIKSVYIDIKNGKEIVLLVYFN